MTQPPYTTLRIAPGTRVGASPPPWGRVGCDPGFQPGVTFEIGATSLQETKLRRGVCIGNRRGFRASDFASKSVAENASFSASSGKTKL